MKIILATVLLLIALAAIADTFEDRVKLADAAEANTEYASFQDRLSDPLHNDLADAMTPCFADLGGKQPDAFTLVADILDDGAVTNVAVTPESNFALCVAKYFSGGRLPAPPKYPGRAGFPIDLKMKFHDK